MVMMASSPFFTLTEKQQKKGEKASCQPIDDKERGPIGMAINGHNRCKSMVFSSG